MEFRSEPYSHLPDEIIQELAALHEIAQNSDLPAEERERAVQRMRFLQRPKVRTLIWYPSKIAAAVEGLRRHRERQWLKPLIEALEDIQPGERVCIQLRKET
jgi:hypothetical protein